jgi:D-amino-acid dehydrogenase
MHHDVVVLGAGIVGICAALHLQKRGRSVALVDRRGAAEETSFGNAGLIQREAVYPYGFPQDLATILRHGFNRSVDSHYHRSALPALAPFLWQYWKHSKPARHAALARKYAPLIENSVLEHDALAKEAGATGLFRRNGWLKVFRSAQERDKRFAEAEHLRHAFGVNSQALDAAGLRSVEPYLDASLAGALHWIDPISVADPQRLAHAYLRHFERLGGTFVRGDATSLRSEGHGWRMDSRDGPVTSSTAVIALGPWSDTLTSALGYSLPLAVKRGYHMHYAASGVAELAHPVLDAERGYVLAPMQSGIRLTTGAEFALRDATRTAVQLARAEPIARTLFPLGDRLDREPWMGARSCTPDMLPIVGSAGRHRNLWFDFGHAHHGLTLGPATGRLVAELITGEAPFVDPAPYSPSRFEGRPAFLSDVVPQH